MLIVACGLISVSCSNEELSIDNTATESELFSKKPVNPGGGTGGGKKSESESLAVTATFYDVETDDYGLGIYNDEVGNGDYVDGSSQQVNSNIRYGDGVGGALYHYALSMWGNKRNPSRELVINLNNPVIDDQTGVGPPKLGVSSSSTFLRVGNIHTLLVAGNSGFGFVVTRANDLEGEDYRIRCDIDLDNNLIIGNQQVEIRYDGMTWYAEMTAGNDKCSVYLVKKPNDVFIGEYHIPFKLELVAQ